MLPKVRIGELRQRVTIQEDRGTDDAYGEPEEDWQPIATGVPAEVIFKTGRESVNAQQTKAVASWRVRHRYRTDVTPAHRFVVEDTGKILSIAGGGDPDGRRREQAWDCSEVVLPEAEG